MWFFVHENQDIWRPKQHLLIKIHLRVIDTLNSSFFAMVTVSEDEYFYIVSWKLSKKPYTTLKYVRSRILSFLDHYKYQLYRSNFYPMSIPTQHINVNCGTRFVWHHMSISRPFDDQLVERPIWSVVVTCELLAMFIFAYTASIR